MAQEYRYTAMDAEGKRVNGVISADNDAAFHAALYERGLVALNFQAASAAQASGGWSLGSLFGGSKKTQEPVEPGKQTPKTTFSDWLGSITQTLPIKQLILFTRQFQTLYASGISLNEVFSILHSQVTSKVLRTVIADIHERVSTGQSLTAAFRAHPKVFPPLYCAMIAAGEQSGAMDTVLERLIIVMQHEDDTKKKIASAVRYPKMVLFVMFGAFLVLLNFVVPQFASIYGKAGVELPLPTQMAILLNELLSDYGIIVLAVVAALIFLFKRWVKTPSGRYRYSSIALHTPVLGQVIQKSVIARFAAIFGILIRSGVSILDSIDILKSTVDNAFFESEFDQVRNDLRQGESIAQAFGKTKGFSPLAISLLTVGERSANMDNMMDELARHYDEEVTHAVDQMTDYLGPALILCLGVVVLFFALAIFMPMWDMVKLV